MRGVAWRGRGVRMRVRVSILFGVGSVMGGDNSREKMPVCLDFGDGVCSNMDARRSKLAQLWKILKQHFLNYEREPVAQNLHDWGASGGHQVSFLKFFEICQDRKAMTHRDHGCVNFA